MSSLAARSVLRSTASRTTQLRSRLAFAAKTKPAVASPFSIPKQNQNLLSHRIFRSPAELSCCVETLLPYHTATASALLTSKLEVSQRFYVLIPEGE
ncbi:protein NUCLEAR FUSION DEFECTIVE 6, mitochondrial isoform X3 [Rosa chinensis]|uniref:protein NUCLEAR FUSION DEFECTIVE 6, mitochondrial isoform X3 n=1 Tax=Rosa chinensis TaxID=74649 RepID=UPI001AD94DE0|nr:protein NUCLEAR FUSION DEFECTIVE 6, mitochondrial isoform X3 [Rosa chinensis]